MKTPPPAFLEQIVDRTLLFHHLLEIAAEPTRVGLVFHLLTALRKLTACGATHFFDVFQEGVVETESGRKALRPVLVSPLDPEGRELAPQELAGIETALGEKRFVSQPLPGGGERLLLPVLDGERVQSILVVEFPGEDRPGREMVAFLATLFHHQEILHKTRDQDPLTGLLNRRSFDEIIGCVLNSLSKRSREKRQPGDGACLAVFDIDHFKSVNDRFGHAIGDEVLILFARFMGNLFRYEDKLFRFGGEEFLGILTSVDESKAHQALERFRDWIGNHEFPQVGRVTVSIGYVMINRGDYPPVLLEKADAALYFAKEHGRDQVRSYERLALAGLIPEVDHPGGEVELWE